MMSRIDSWSFAHFFGSQFFPKTERYVSLFKGEEDEEVRKKREGLRKLVKQNIAKAQAEGLELEGIE